MYDGRDKNINSQTNSSTKHILNTYAGVMQNKIYCKYIMINIYILTYVLEYLIVEKDMIIIIIDLILILTTRIARAFARLVLKIQKFACCCIFT